MRHRSSLPVLFLLLLTPGAPPLAAAQRQGFELSVVVDGCEAPEYEHGGRLYIEALRGRSFALRVSNPTSERIAVALSVDGRNVVDAKRSSALDAAKWILSPGQTLEIPGWQVSGEVARKFFFTETSRSYAKWLGDTRNVGTIEAVFFREKRRWPQPLSGVEGGAPGGELRDRGEGAREEAPKSAGVAGRASPSRENESDRMAATGIGERTDFPVRWVDFEEDPDPAARIALRYEFHRELVRMGILPRSDDALAARERARGFEPRYAPDPGRDR
jgi:hypothetical protein